MKILQILLALLLTASPVLAAKQSLVNGEAMSSSRAKINSNFTEVYSLAIAAPWLAQTTAPSIHNVFWVDTSGTSPVIKYWDGDSWEVAAAGEGGTYTLPTASAETKGGVKIGARLTMTGEVLSADVQTTDISGKENSLGNPSVNGYVLSSTTGGTRSWIEMTGGVAGISHAPSDGNPYASRNGAWYSLAGLYAAALGTDDNYVTDAEKTKLTNLSGTNSGDNAVNSNYSSLVTNATHTGDVTGSGALTIANGAVSLAKMANMATGSLIYRKTASTGAPEVQTLATLKTDLGLTGTNSGDQTATTTAFTPNGTIAATTVQAAIQEVRDEAGGSFDPASPGAIGGTTPAAGTFTTIGAGAGGFTVDADGDLIAKSIGTARSATIGSIFDLYEGSNNGDNKVTIQPSAALSVDKTIVAENILQTTDVDTSAKLRAIVTDESGTGALFFAGGDVAAATATTPSANDNDTSIATTAYVQTEIAATASDSLTLTNKTLDTAGTGNAITVPLNGVLDGAITDPADADDMIYARAANAMTVTGIDCQAEGTTPSITVTLQKCNDLACGTPTAIEAAITCDADGGAHASTIDSASITTGTPIKVVFGTPSGTVNSVRWRVIGTQTW